MPRLLHAQRSGFAALLRAIALMVLGLHAPIGYGQRASTNNPAPADLVGRIVAVGIPGAGAVSAVGSFHAGGPMYDDAAFRKRTQPSAILDPERILVASSSNFAAPLARKDQAAGAILSIDPRGTMLRVPSDFAVAGGQASAVGGRVLLFTANSPAFLNRVHNASAVTADYPSVAHPTAISLNNAFGRPWFASAPSGAKGPGTHSVIDPDGAPLAGAPYKIAGGVFTGALTNRAPQLVPGAFSTASLALALLGKSSDGSGRAVFAGLQSDGSLVQVQVELGVDGLAPAGTIAPQDDLRRRGMVFNWVPNRILYVTEPARNAIVALTLVVDGDVLRLEGKRQIAPVGLNLPIDIAPAVLEVANPGFSSNTTLAGNADMYVANRGNGTIVRLKQDGTVVAIRRVTLPGVGAIGRDRLNGIAVSADASRIWLTISGRLPGNPEGAVIEVPAFGAPTSARS